MRTWSRGARPPSGAWISRRQYLPGHRGGRAGSATHIRAATEQISQFGRSKSANRDGQEAVEIRRFVRDWLRKWRVRCARAQGRGRARAGRSGMTVAIASLGMSGGRIEQLALLRAEQPAAETTLVVRGGRDTVDKLRGQAVRTARAWLLDGQPLLGISVFVVLGMPLEVRLRRRFSSCRTIYLPTAGELGKDGFELLATAPVSPSGWSGPMTGSRGNCWPLSGPPGPIPVR